MDRTPLIQICTSPGYLIIMFEVSRRVPLWLGNMKLLRTFLGARANRLLIGLPRLTSKIFMPDRRIDLSLMFTKLDTSSIWVLGVLKCGCEALSTSLAISPVMRSQRDSQIAGIHGCLGGMNLAERSPNDIADHRKCATAMHTLACHLCHHGAAGIPLGAVACKLLFR